jgi:hypothetical protein
VNSIEEVEKHMKKWLKKQEEISKTRQKIQKWKDSKKNNETIAQIEKDEKKDTEMDKFKCLNKTRTQMKNEHYKIRNKEKLEEWKEMKQFKRSLEESNNVLKNFSYKQNEPKQKICYDIPIINPMPHRSLSYTVYKPNSVQKKTKVNDNSLKFLNIVQHEANFDIIKSFQERDRQMINDRKEQRSNGNNIRNRSSFEDIHPMRVNGTRFNSSQFLTSSMVDLSSYNNPTQSSQAKITTLVNPTGNQQRPSTSQTYPESRRKSALMQIEHVPRLRIPTWRTIS